MVKYNYLKTNMLQKLFGFDPTRHKVRTEIFAGITTFLTMAYILAVNPGIFSALESQGMPTSAVFTATILAAAFGTLAMAFYAKKPFGLAPGMGINAFFVFGVCLGMGHSWQFALTAVFIEGILFIILSLFKIREKIANAIPSGIKAAIGGGIGLFVAFIGLQNSGIIIANESTQVALANFNTPSVLLALIGIVICGFMVVRKIPGGLLWGILITAAIGIPMGVTHWDKLVSTPPSIAPIFLKFEWSQIFTWDMLIVTFTFLFVDFFDTIGTVIGVSLKAKTIDKDGKVPGVGRMLMADALATTVGACFGTSTTTTYVESIAGVAVGGRTGLTAFIVAIDVLCSAVPCYPCSRNGSGTRHCGRNDGIQHHRGGMGRLFRGYSCLHHDAYDAAELQHQRWHHVRNHHVCADEILQRQGEPPPNHSHDVGSVRDFHNTIYTKEPVIKKSASSADFLLDQYSRLLAIGGIAGFVSELALLHERDGDTEEQCCHSYRTEDKPVKAVQCRIHDPNSPPELNLSEIVRMAAVFPKSHIADLPRMSRTKIMALLIGDELDRRGRKADKEAKY